MSEPTIETEPPIQGFPIADLSALTHGDFAACVGKNFSLEGPQGRRFAAELVSAELLSPRTAGESTSRRREPFGLIFRLPEGSYLPQQIYRLEQERFGRLDIFLVPVGRDESGLRLEAIFT